MSSSSENTHDNNLDYHLFQNNSNQTTRPPAIYVTVVQNTKLNEGKEASDLGTNDPQKKMSSLTQAQITGAFI